MSTQQMAGQGNENYALSRANRETYPGVYESLRELVKMGANVPVYNGAAKSRGYRSDEFCDLAIVVPATPTDLVRLRGEGYRYVAPSLRPRVTREEVAAR